MKQDLNLQEALNYTYQQIFGEGYWNKYYTDKYERPADSLLMKRNIIASLQAGNTREEDPTNQKKYTKLTETLALQAFDKYEIIDHIDNDPIKTGNGVILKNGTNGSGFSGTVLKDKQNNEITLVMRSTEYVEDFYRDAVGADMNINKNGFAFAQR